MCYLLFPKYTVLELQKELNGITAKQAHLLNLVVGLLKEKTKFARQVRFSPHATGNRVIAT